MKPGAALINIARGEVVDWDAQVAALDSGRLRASYTDVTSPEPLPDGHPLWSVPSLFITPHNSGLQPNYFGKAAYRFAENLRRFINNEPSATSWIAMPATEAGASAAPQRHGVFMPARGTFVEAGRDRDVSRMPDPDIRFGIGLWPSEAMAYLEPEDAFTDAAVRLRQLGPKLVAALQEMQVPLEDLKNRTVGAIEEELTQELVERTPLRVDLVARYIAELLDHIATIVPHCYGVAGDPLREGVAVTGDWLRCRCPMSIPAWRTSSCLRGPSPTGPRR